MTGEDTERDELAEMPLRDRVWWRFWRGWRLAIANLVALVAVAWWTNPDVRDHAVEYHKHMTETMRDVDPTDGRILHSFVYPGFYHEKFEDHLVFGRGLSAHTPAKITIGFFDMVWALD